MNITKTCAGFGLALCTLTPTSNAVSIRFDELSSSRFVFSVGDMNTPGTATHTETLGDLVGSISANVFTDPIYYLRAVISVVWSDTWTSVQDEIHVNWPWYWSTVTQAPFAVEYEHNDSVGGMTFVYGTARPPSDIPDAGSAIGLLGLALAGLGIWRRV